MKVPQYIHYMPRKKPSDRLVREPVQVYLAPDDRQLLDSLARTTGLSRAEILRRGIRSFAAAASGASGARSPMLAFLEETSGADWPEGAAEHHDDFLARSYRST